MSFFLGASSSYIFSSFSFFFSVSFSCGHAALQLAVLVSISVGHMNCERFLHYCPCPTIRDCLAVYPALLPLVNSITMCWVRYPLLAQLPRRFLFFYSFGNGKVDTDSIWRIHDFIVAVSRVMDWQNVSLWTAPILSCLYVRSNNQNAQPLNL